LTNVLLYQLLIKKNQTVDFFLVRKVKLTSPLKPQYLLVTLRKEENSKYNKNIILTIREIIEQIFIKINIHNSLQISEFNNPQFKGVQNHLFYEQHIEYILI
jgi:hypothetical protein